MLVVSKPGALNCYIFFRPILLTLSVFRNLISTYLLLSGSQDSLLCDLIAPTSGLAFSFVITRMLVAATSFLSDRAYFSLNFLPPLSLCLIPTLIMKESTSLLTTPPRSPFLIFMLPLFTLLRQMAEQTSFLPPPKISLFWGTSIAISPSGTQKIPPTLMGRKYSIGSSLPLFLALALSCSWEVLQDLGSDYLPILLLVPLSKVFCPNERPSSFNFQKACWDDFASYIDSRCPSAEESPSHSLSSAGTLFTSLALNAAKSSTTFDCIKRPPKAWWSVEVEDVVSEMCKAFAAAHRNDVDRQAYISASRRALSVIAQAKAVAWQVTCSLSPKSNPKSYTLCFDLVLAPFSHLPPLLTSPTVALPGNRLQSLHSFLF